MKEDNKKIIELKKDVRKFADCTLILYMFMVANIVWQGGLLFLVPLNRLQIYSFMVSIMPLFGVLAYAIMTEIGHYERKN